MPRLIDADALIKDMETVCSSTQFGRATAKMCVKRATTIDAVPVVRGEWTHAINEYFRTCSVCGISMGLLDGEDLSRFKYCPFCGAKMEDKPCG